MTMARSLSPNHSGATHRRSLYALALLVLASPALAHDGHGPHGFAGGLLHPLTGIDHLLAIVAVGWWSAATQAARWWIVPLAFALSMLIGAMTGLAGMSAPATELLLALSVISFGALLLWRVRAPLVPAAALAAGFALLHGLAHGSEAPREGTTIWLLGMLASTLALHLAGALAARLTRRRARWLRPLAGGVGVATGFALAVALIAG